MTIQNTNDAAMPTDARTTPPPPCETAAPAAADFEVEVKAYRFEDLAAGQSVVHIELHGTQYTLRRTRAGGLILNK